MEKINTLTELGVNPEIVAIVNDVANDIDRTALHNYIEEMEKRIAELQREVSFGLSPSDFCHKYHVQNCHVCNDMECGDNISPAKKRIDVLEKALELCNASRNNHAARDILVSITTTDNWIVKAQEELCPTKTKNK